MQVVLDAIWDGDIIYSPTSFIDLLPDHYNRKPIMLYDSSRSPILNQHRLIVPRIRALLEAAQFIVLFASYCAVLFCECAGQYGQLSHGGKESISSSHRTDVLPFPAPLPPSAVIVANHSHATREDERLGDLACRLRERMGSGQVCECIGWVPEREGNARRYQRCGLILLASLLDIEHGLAGELRRGRMPYRPADRLIEVSLTPVYCRNLWNGIDLSKLAQRRHESVETHLPYTRANSRPDPTLHQAFIGVFALYLILRLLDVSAATGTYFAESLNVLACGSIILFPRFAFWVVSRSPLVLGLRRSSLVTHLLFSLDRSQSTDETLL